MRDAGTPAQPGHYASTAKGAAQVRPAPPPGSLAAPGRAGDNRDMDITLNGEPRQLAAPTTISSLLEAEGLAGRRVAVEVNGTIVPRGQHEAHALADGDQVEIVHALGGG